MSESSSDSARTLAIVGCVLGLLALVISLSAQVRTTGVGQGAINALADAQTGDIVAAQHLDELAAKVTALEQKVASLEATAVAPAGDATAAADAAPK